jgi:hypothetical protein
MIAGYTVSAPEGIYNHIDRAKRYAILRYIHRGWKHEFRGRLACRSRKGLDMDFSVDLSHHVLECLMDQSSILASLAMNHEPAGT